MTATLRVAALTTIALTIGATATIYALWQWIDHGLARISW